ncbi:unnamed protein product [Pylaiella littoralis]
MGDWLLKNFLPRWTTASHIVSETSGSKFSDALVFIFLYFSFLMLKDTD